MRAPRGVADALPAPVRALVAAAPSMTVADLLPPGIPTRTPPSGAPPARAAAVLVLLSGGGPASPDEPLPGGAAAGADPGAGTSVVLIERSARGVHGGQAAFPGGGVEPGDADAAATALREAAEEVGLDPAGVTVLGTLPALPVPVSGYLVTPVLAWQAVAGALVVADPAEVVAVRRVPLAVLADPAHRVRVRARRGAAAGWLGPGFALEGLLVWGFTALLLDALLRAAGLERAWDGGGLRAVVVDAPVPGGRTGRSGA